MRRLLAFSIIVSLHTISLAPVSSAQISWQQVTDREAGFTVSFPGRPTYQTAIDPTTKLQTEIYKFFYTGRLLRVTFAPLSQPVRTPVEINRVYSDFTLQVIPRGGTLLRQQKLPEGGQQYDTVANEKDRTIYGRTRFYIRNARYYAIAFEMYAQNGIDEREAERFLSSFRFLGAVAGRRATTRNLPMKIATNGSEQAKRYTFFAPGGDFSIKFPRKPDYQLDPSSGESTPFHRYHYFHGENIFQVSYREDPKASTQPEQVIQKAIEVYTSNRDEWRVLRQVKLSDGGYQIESQRRSGDVHFYSQVRLYVRGTRIYYVTALTENLEGANKDDLARFFESFRFL